MADTIAAISTAHGVSGVGIIRISGSRAIEAADAVFSRYGGKMADAEDRKLCLGELRDAEGEVIDVCLCTVSRAPNSYTGENTAEIQTHGSPVVLYEGLRALFAVGVRQAKQGEFTKRAFLNGRMDLSRAEAVIDIIEAQSAAAAKNAVSQLGGAISRRTDAIYDELRDVCSHFHAVIDYPDEDIDEFELSQYAETFDRAERELAYLAATFERGKLMKDGVPCAIIGLPNAGKSSLMNALLGYERAIVTDIAGTTRDTIEERINLGSVTLRLTDTAGIRDAEDAVEKLGVIRAREAAERADLVLAVVDGTDAKADCQSVLDAARAAKKHIIVITKSDLETAFNPAKDGEKVCVVSSKTGRGLDNLCREIEKTVGFENTAAGEALLTNTRQLEAVLSAAQSLRSARTAAMAGLTPDAVLSEVEQAMSALGEISGRTVREDVTNRIFERFCVGK